jgi:hypothetical protein
LYLRREALLVAVEKLKNGETIGPVTKAYKDKEEDKKEEEGIKKEEEAENVGEKKKETEEKEEMETDQERASAEEGKTEQVIVKEDTAEDASDEDSSEKEGELTTAPESPISEASEQTVKLAADTEESTEATPKLGDSDATSEATSTESDLPPTPASIEPITTSNETEPEPDLDEFVQANIHESLELRNPVPSKPAGSLTPEDKLLPVTPPVPETPTHPPKPTSSSTDTAVVTGVAPLVRTEGPIPAVLVNSNPEEDETKTEVVVPEQSAKTMVGWEMLQMCVNWVIKEFSTDEEALARQLSNNEISFRFLWLYFVPGTIVSLQDPVSKQQMAARVMSPTHFVLRYGLTRV